MKKIVLIYLLCVSCFRSFSQELFVFAEPASNMPSRTLGFRIMGSSMKENDGIGYNNHFMPEVMYGINQKIMLSYSTFLSNRNNSLLYEGGSFYAKYKFLNIDDVQKHFRMAAFTRYSHNNADIHQDEINLIGHNTGLEAGLVATQLLHKLALSGSLSYINAKDNGAKYEFPKSQSNNGLYYTFSAGRLVLPKVYKDYDQTNVNLMLEFIGQTLMPNNKTYIDIAPSIQFIIKSNLRIDIGYRHQLYSDMKRTASNGLIVRMDYHFYNLL
jgi:hypothetical protein